MEEHIRIKNFLETTISCLKGSNDGYVKVYKYNLEILENILNELERLQKENEELKNKKYLMSISCDGECQICEHYKNEYLLENKIRNKIEKRKKHCTVINSFVIEALEDLLGDE